MITRIEKFGASWCGPCKVLDRTLEQISRIEIVKHNVDEEVKRTIGAVSLGTIMQIVNNN